MVNIRKTFFKMIYLCVVLCPVLFLSACNNNDIGNYEKASNDTLKATKTFTTTNKLNGFGGANMETDEMKSVQKELDDILKQGKMVSFVVVNTKTQN